MVCFNSTTTPELVKDGCGTVLESLDADSMLSAAREIITKGKEFYSDYCRETALSLFSKDDNIGEYIAVFENLIGEK